MNMRVEGDEVTEGLHVKNESGLTPRVHGFEAGPQQDWFSFPVGHTPRISGLKESPIRTGLTTCPRPPGLTSTCD